jgi:hypothetical protein
MTQAGFPNIDARRSVEPQGPQEGGALSSASTSLLGPSVEADGAGTYAPLATWAIVSAIALGAGALLGGQPAAAVAAGVGALVAVLLVPFERLSRLLTLAALVPAALTDAPVAAWLLAGACVAYAVGRSRAPVVVSMNELERHLSWCRRRDEKADVLTMRIAGKLRDPARLVRAFRITDSVELRRRADGYDLTAVLDHCDLDRTGIERRLGELGFEPAACGWALFPRDGFTLETLVERARRSPLPVQTVEVEAAVYRGSATPVSRNVA